MVRTDEPTIDTGTATDPVGPVDGTGRSRRRLGSSRAVRSTLPVVGLIGAWWVATSTVLQPPRIYPSPLDVGGELVRIISGEGPLGSTYGHAGATLGRLLAAFLVAFLLGTLIGVAAGRSKPLFDFLNSLAWIALAVPSVVWVFIFLVVLGISNIVPVAAMVLLLGAPVFIGTAEGVKAVSKDLIAMADSFHVRGWQRLTQLFLPSIVPYMAANARVAFALGIKLVIIAEVVGLPNGVGLLVRYWSDSLQMAPVVAWGVLLIILGFVVDRQVFGRLEDMASRWAGAPAGPALHVE